ncbi:MAG: hypothetical protein LBH16_02030 [Treponema sp.]|jgi:hypothetical protein|nr:hypothetical protein [Treponema sp.]
MKKIFILLVFIITALPLSAQANIFRIAAGAQSQLENLLNKPGMVKPASAVPLGKNWFTLETDAHVFSDEVTLKQVVAVLLDLENQPRYFKGKRSELDLKIVNRTENEIIVDFISIAIVVGIRMKTPYRAALKVITNTETAFGIDLNQLPQDSETNKDIKKLTAPRYVEEVTINGKKYTYIRIYSIMDVDAKILPNARNTLERNSTPTNEEALHMIINAAKTK